MAKNVFEDKELVDIVQLASRQEISDATGEDYQKVEAEIVARMSEKSLNWYLNHIVPVVGRPILKKKWEKIRKESNMKKMKTIQLDGTHEENLNALKRMLGLKPEQDLSEFKENDK